MARAQTGTCEDAGVTLTVLPTTVRVDTPRPDVGGGPAHPMRVITRETAFGNGPWTPERAAKVSALFDSMAPSWTGRDGPDRHASLHDALARGGPFASGACLEVGSGTGEATSILRAQFDDVIALDLSREMLRYAPADSPRVQADSSALPVADHAAAVVALINMLLFPAEVDRVLAPTGALLWVNTLGDATPIHLPAADVLDALPGTWHGVTAEAGWGTWLVARRA
jgi:SAM-dependent methyltransferase